MASIVRAIAASDRRPRTCHALAEPHDPAKTVEDAERPDVGAGKRLARDQQPAIVGAEVERGVDRSVVSARTRLALFHRDAILGFAGTLPWRDPQRRVVKLLNRAQTGRNKARPRPIHKGNLLVIHPTQGVVRQSHTHKSSLRRYRCPST